MSQQHFSHPLVGRDADLALLDGLLGDAEAGKSRFAVLWGEPGIGKTRLLDALTERADERGFLVLEGSAAEFERGVPFSVLVDALDAYLAALDAQAFERLAADGVDDLAAVFPSLRRMASDTAAAGAAAERFRIHHAVRELLERLAARRPLLLALDDLHWADGASLELAAHLLRRPPTAGVLIVATLRTGQAAPTVAGAIEAAARAGRVAQLELGPLSSADAALLLDGADPRRRESLYRESGGNPFYLEELARDSTTAGAGTATSDAARVAGGAPAGVTRAVALAIEGELAGLSEAARTLAAAGAVVGDPFDLDLTAAVGEFDEHAVLVAVDELAECRLIGPADLPRRMRFRHPLVRRAIFVGLPPGWRLAAHGRAAAALAAAGAPPEVRAHHVEASARQGDEAAAALLSEAGRAVAARDPETAGRWFDAALRLLPSAALPDAAADGARLGLLTASAGARAATGRFGEAREALLAALELAGDDVDLRVGLIASCAGVEQLLGRHRDAHDRLIATLDDLPDRTSAQAASLMIDLATVALYRMEYGEIIRWGAQALAVARPLGDRALTAAAAAVHGLGCAFAGAVDHAETSCAEAGELIDSMPDEELARRVDAAAHLAGAELYLDRYDDTQRHGQRGLAVARATGQGDLFPMFVPALSTSSYMLGRLDDAADLLDGAIEGARLAGNAQGLAWTLLNRGFTATSAGDLDGALAFADESVGLTRTMDESFVATYARVQLAYATADTGDHEQASRLLVEAAGGETLPRVAGGWRAYYLELLTRCRLATGDREGAGRAAAEAGAVAADTRLPLPAAMAQRADAAIAFEAGDLAFAAECAKASAAVAHEIGAPIEAARSRLLAGRALAAAGDRDGAILELEAAEAAALECGAREAKRLASGQLRRLGRRRAPRSRPASRGADGVASLSDREREVADLVTARKTNREIAADLFLSEKTVETHLRNIFFKLDVSSRVQVALAIERER